MTSSSKPSTDTVGTIKPFDCQECGRLIESKEFEYHPYWYCVLQKAGQLDFAKADLERLMANERLDELHHVYDSDALYWHDNAEDSITVGARMNELRNQLISNEKEG